MLSKLSSKFIDERSTAEREEANSKEAYELLMQKLKEEIVQAVKEKHHKQLSRTKVLENKADESSDLHDTQDAEGMDEKYLKELQATCHMKAGDFEARQALRGQEIGAIEK